MILVMPVLFVILIVSVHTCAFSKIAKMLFLEIILTANPQYQQSLHPRTDIHRAEYVQ